MKYTFNTLMRLTKEQLLAEAQKLGSTVDSLTKRSKADLADYVLWLVDEERTLTEEEQKLVDEYESKTDAIVERFCGKWVITDYSNSTRYETKADLMEAVRYNLNEIAKEESSASSAPAADGYEFERVEPCYTGGGVYVFTGKLTNGNYFISNVASADDSWAVIVDADPDEDPEESCFEEWQTAHLVEDVESPDAFIVPMLEWVKANEPDGNYQMDDMDRLMEAFCDSSEADADEPEIVLEISRIAIKTETFCTPWEGQLYCIDICEDSEERMAWLYNSKYGIKMLMFGEEVKNDRNEFLDRVFSNVPYDIEIYQEEYEDQ